MNNLCRVYCRCLIKKKIINLRKLNIYLSATTSQFAKKKKTVRIHEREDKFLNIGKKNNSATPQNYNWWFYSPDIKEYKFNICI